MRLITHLFENNLQDDLGAIAEAFGQYEQIRRPIMEDIQQATLSGFYQNVEEWESYNQRIYHRNFPVQ